MTDSDSVGRWFESSRAYQKERHAFSVSLFLGFAARWPAPPFGISMRGGSTRKGYATSVRRQSRQRLCGEFRLRRGFACGKTLARRKSAAGQKAGCVAFIVTGSKLKISILTSPSKIKGNCESSCLLFWVPAAGGGLHPSAFLF